jgi:hypothetical protein
MANAERKKEGDTGFLAIDTRANPATLKEGYLQDGRNIRLESTTLETRRGIKQIFSNDRINSILAGLPEGSEILASGLNVLTDGTEQFIIVVADGLFTYNTTTDVLSNRYNFPNGRQCLEDKTQVLQAVNKVYILRGETERFINGTSIYTSSTHNIGVTTATTHNLVVGDEVILESPHTQMSGAFIVVSTLTSTTFTVNNPAATGGNLGSHPVLIAKARPPLVFDGYTVSVTKQGTIDGSINNQSTLCCFPPSSVGFYFRNRIYIKYSRDEIAVSYFLPNGTGDWEFDLTIQAFQINLGDEQEIVGFYPWTQDKVLVLKTNSIYELKVSDNTTSPEVVLSQSYVRALTTEIGCTAKRSIGNVSSSVFFLSQSGVYALEPQLDTNLLANSYPLSKSVQKYIDAINVNEAYKSIGQVFAGRYYLAVPLTLNGVARVGVLVYNLNNKNWESCDTYPIGFNVDNIIVSIYGNRKRLFFIDNERGPYLAEELDVDLFGDTYGARVLPLWLPFYLRALDYSESKIDLYALTRRYQFNTLQDKRFTAAEIDCFYGTEGALKVDVKSINPDSTLQIDISTASGGEELTRKVPVRKKCIGMEIELTSLQGRPSVFSAIVEATSSGRNLHSER